MKIMVALHQVMDLGGIINHTEQLIGGLKDLGHRVDFRQFVWADNAMTQNKDGDWLIGPSGIKYDQGKGWNFKREQRIAYKGVAGVHAARMLMSEYDLIIWTVPVPSKNNNNLGNNDWPMLYDLPPKVKQVAFVHDGNIRSGAPHLLHVEEHLTAIACVHACALNGANFFKKPRALVLNPQFEPVRHITPWQFKHDGFVNMQTFKAWKHVHELVRAIAYMPQQRVDEFREIAGKGIEYQYMTSEDKCKDEYFHYDVDKAFNGQKIWDTALQNGMTHHGYWNDIEVDNYLRNAKVLVDPSWSKKYSQIGGHWNRVVVDAMIRGCVPVAQPKGMGNELFRENVHYVPLKTDISPDEYANIVLETSAMDEKKAHQFREANLELLHLFDRRVVAKRLLDLVDGNLDSTEVRIGTHEPQMIAKSRDIMFEHFGVA